MAVQIVIRRRMNNRIDSLVKKIALNNTSVYTDIILLVEWCQPSWSGVERRGALTDCLPSRISPCLLDPRPPDVAPYHVSSLYRVRRILKSRISMRLTTVVHRKSPSEQCLLYRTVTQRPYSNGSYPRTLRVRSLLHNHLVPSCWRRTCAHKVGL